MESRLIRVESGGTCLFVVWGGKEMKMQQLINEREVLPGHSLPNGPVCDWAPTEEQ